MGGGNLYYRFFGGGQREGYVGRTWPKKPKMALISEYLAADMSPDASADALVIINISRHCRGVALQPVSKCPLPTALLGWHSFQN